MGKSSRENDSVFDFLYVDERKISQFSSQFSEFGELTDIIHSKSTGSDAEISGGVAGFVKGGVKSADDESVEKRFNAQWSKVLSFLDEVRTREMVQRNLEDARIGNLVLVSGELQVATLQPFERAFSALASLQSGPQPSQNRKQRRASQGNQAEDNSPGDQTGLAILGSLEQPIIMVLRSEEKRLWSTLSPAGLIGGAADLNLKHGLELKGEWHVLGVLDCEPGDTLFYEDSRLCGSGAEDMFSGQLRGMWYEFQRLFGRPVDCYGITPIMIMREIA